MMHLATSRRTRAIALAAMAAASAITGFSAGRTAMAQEVQVAAATPQTCMQPTDAEIVADTSGKKTAGFAACVLQNSIAQDQVIIDQNKAETDRLNADTAKLKEREQTALAEQQTALAETKCSEDFKAEFLGGKFDKQKLATYLDGRKPSQIGACNLWNARAAFTL